MCTYINYYFNRAYMIISLYDTFNYRASFYSDINVFYICIYGVLYTIIVVEGPDRYIQRIARFHITHICNSYNEQ